MTFPLADAPDDLPAGRRAGIGDAVRDVACGLCGVRKARSTDWLAE
jgi:hypothetical protein